MKIAVLRKGRASLDFISAAAHFHVRFRQSLGMRGTFLLDDCRERGLDPKIDIMNWGSSLRLNLVRKCYRSNVDLIYI